MDSDAYISHVVSEPPDIAGAAIVCNNIKSKKEPKKRCENTATKGLYCGIHYKHPRPWCPSTPEMATLREKAKVKKAVKLVKKTKEAERIAALQTATAIRIRAWWKFYYGLRAFRRQGPAVWDRSLCTNDSDFFSTDAVQDISGVSFFSYKDEDGHVYGFDIRSIHTLFYRARTSGEAASNPFTRNEFHSGIHQCVLARVRWLRKRGLPTEWEPLAPPTPEQQTRMKIVDLFSKIDELNYYSSPDWFINLDVRGHRAFYSELNAIWTHRAGLSIAQKNMIVPNYHTRLFRYHPWGLRDMNLLELQRVNMNTIRLFISSATDRNDRILGAMYVVSTLTLVNEGARTAYPWLYESVAGGDEPPAQPMGRVRRPGLVNLLGIGWLQDLLQTIHDEAAHNPPPLQLPPPVAPIPEDNVATEEID